MLLPTTTITFPLTVECVQSPAAFFANRLYKAMNGAGTDDATLIRIIVSRSEIDLETIKQEFERIYNRTLNSAVVVSPPAPRPGCECSSAPG